MRYIEIVSVGIAIILILLTLWLWNTKASPRSTTNRSSKAIPSGKSKEYYDNLEIDVVYTWVNGQDANWENKKNIWLQKRNPLTSLPISSVTGDIRYKNINELKYSIRSIDKYMPWVRNIYIVVDDEQKPDFLDFSRDNLYLIKHSDIFSDKNHLPTFNSHAIESNLHRIEGLSKYFIYFNDDMLIGKPVYKWDFIDANGKLIFHKKYVYLSERHAELFMKGMPKKYDIGYRAGWKNNNTILEEKFKSRKYVIPWHQAQICDKDLMKYLQGLYKFEYELTSGAKFRSMTDIAPLGLSVIFDKEMNDTQISINDECLCMNSDKISVPDLIERLKKIKNNEFKFYCINNIVVGSENADHILEFFDEFYPEKSYYEL